MVRRFIHCPLNRMTWVGLLLIRVRSVAINMAQIVFSAVSNISLLLNMSCTIRFSLAQPLTIVGSFVSSLIQVALCATVRGPLKVSHSPTTESLSQAFYFAIFSASFHFLVGALMAWTLLGAELGKYEKRFQLALSQRTIMMQVTILVIYQMAGSAVYAHIEEWKFLDAL